MNIPELKKFKAEIEPWVCTQCGNCRTACPVYEQVGWESASPRGKMYYLKDLLRQNSSKKTRIDEEFVERIFQCSLCVRCEETCQTEIDMMRVWQAVRAEIGRRGQWPDAIKMLHDAVLKDYNLYGLSNENRTIWSMMIEDQVLPRVNKPAEVAYFVGCVAAFTGRVAGIPESTVAILEAAEVDYTVLGSDEWCCGNPLFFVGAHDEAKKLALHNLEKLKALGVKQVITSCAGCYRALANEYPMILGDDLGIEIMHLPQYVAQLIDWGKLKFEQPEEISITYHDPCEIGRHSGIFEEPRYILERLPGVELIEMPNNRENAECCGAGGLLKGADPDLSLSIAGKRLDQAIRTGATDLVSACVACKLQFAEVVMEDDLDIGVHDISEFIARFL
ncbi:MAG: (Fe-S)-binding protein [Anaerolineales bacterium]|nr:(Fe-S)-binding protein [Anaerolineales bacterium]